MRYASLALRTLSRLDFISSNDMRLIPLELMKSNRGSVRGAREAYLINRGQTLEPLGLNRRDET